jgi:hypothetical protein
MAAALACAALLLAPGSAGSQQRSGSGHATAAPAGADFDFGDLLEFRLMAEEALVLAKGGDLSAAKKQIKVLGSAWNDAEGELRPRGPASWTAIDKAMDRAIETLHATTPYAAASTAAIEKLIAALDSSERR